MPLCKLKHVNLPARLVFFDAPPSWDDLASKISKIFGIPLENVGVAYIDEARLSILVTNEQGLQQYYKCLGPSSEEIKLVVLNAEDHDCESAVPFMSHIAYSFLTCSSSISLKKNCFNLVRRFQSV